MRPVEEPALSQSKGCRCPLNGMQCPGVVPEQPEAGLINEGGTPACAPWRFLAQLTGVLAYIVPEWELRRLPEQLSRLPPRSGHSLTLYRSHFFCVLVPVYSFPLSIVNIHALTSDLRLTLGKMCPSIKTATRR